MDISNLKSSPQSDMSKLFEKNDKNQTLLAEAIIQNDEKSIDSLLAIGAAKSIFVQGYFPGSLVCTLPQTSQPPSGVFDHPPPLTTSSAVTLSKLDDAMCVHIESLKQHKIQLVAAKSNNSQPTAILAPSQPSAPATPPFNPLPATLQVGDTVRRGPDWTWGSQDGTPGNTGTIIQWSPPDGRNLNVVVQWTGGSTNSYAYDHIRPKFDVCLVDPNDPSNLGTSFYPSGQKVREDPFKVGDKVKYASTPGEVLDGRLAVVVEAKQKKKRMENGVSDFCFKLADLQNDTLCEQSSSKLRYADGSTRLVHF